MSGSKLRGTLRSMKNIGCVALAEHVACTISVRKMGCARRVELIMMSGLAQPLRKAPRTESRVLSNRAAIDARAPPCDWSPVAPRLVEEGDGPPARSSCPRPREKPSAPGTTEDLARQFHSHRSNRDRVRRRSRLRPHSLRRGKALCSKCSSCPATVPVARATAKASFTWPRICGSPTTIESRLAATRKRCRTAPRARCTYRCGRRSSVEAPSVSPEKGVDAIERMFGLGELLTTSTRLQVDRMTPSCTPGVATNACTRLRAGHY